MPGKIPWEIIGPVATGVTIILAVVFAFMLKWKKLDKRTPVPSNPPKDINSTGKKTLCFAHHGDIAANKKAIEMIGENLKEANENNRQDHKDMFEKIDGLGEKIITEIHKENEGK